MLASFASVALGLQGQPDPWGFDEAPVETWADILRPQALDLALLTAFLVLALVSFHRKSVPLKFVTFAAAIGYMGLSKSYLISITNIFSTLDWNWPVFKYNLAWYLFFGFTVGSTILFGRLYCGRICAYGALTQSLDAILPRTSVMATSRSVLRSLARTWPALTSAPWATSGGIESTTPSIPAKTSRRCTGSSVPFPSSRNSEIGRAHV